MSPNLNLEHGDCGSSVALGTLADGPSSSGAPEPFDGHTSISHPQHVLDEKDTFEVIFRYCSTCRGFGHSHQAEQIFEELGARFPQFNWHGQRIVFEPRDCPRRNHVRAPKPCPYFTMTGKLPSKKIRAFLSEGDAGAFKSPAQLRDAVVRRHPAAARLSWPGRKDALLVPRLRRS